MKRVVPRKDLLLGNIETIIGEGSSLDKTVTHIMGEAGLTRMSTASP